jgi:RHS repeat-associated protein
VKLRSLRFEFDILKNQRRKSVMGCANRIKQGRDRLPCGSRTNVDEESILSPSSQLQSADAWGYGPEIPGAPTTASYHADGNGNVTALMYPNQQLAAKYLYDPFGNTLAMSGPLRDFNKYRFSSKEWNENSGLYYYLYRFYEPGLQRWPNRDPLRELGGINLYDFARNDPISYSDRQGLGIWPITPWRIFKTIFFYQPPTTAWTLCTLTGSSGLICKYQCSYMYGDQFEGGGFDISATKASKCAGCPSGNSIGAQHPPPPSGSSLPTAANR